MDLTEYIHTIPKAELHLHIEGTLEPEMMFELAERNSVELPYSSVEELKNAYHFNNLQDFLDLYYAGTSVLLKEEDFFDLTKAYLRKIHEQGVIHTEIFFDPQSHTARDVPFEVVIDGIYGALKWGRETLGITSKLLLSFLRHLDQDSAFSVWNEAKNHLDKIDGAGLDSSELGHPPGKFAEIYKIIRETGLPVTAHAGEEGPPEYIWEALKELKVSRVDHGNRAIEDEELLQVLVEKKIPLTMCPLSNLKLKVVHDLKNHPLKKMLDMGLTVTVNSDDPAYFGGYLEENYLQLARALSLSEADIYRVAENSFLASFLTPLEKQEYLDRLSAFKPGGGPDNIA